MNGPLPCVMAMIHAPQKGEGRVDCIVPAAAK